MIYISTRYEVNQYSTNYTSEDGEYRYYESDACNENNQTGCSNEYDTSDVKKIVDGWSSSFGDDLVNINNYKTRIIGNEIYDIFNLEYTNYPNMGPTNSTPNWAIIDNPYWADATGYNNKALSVSITVSSELIYNKLYIRPIIYLKKNAIESGCVNYDYVIGQSINYNNSSYCVVNNSKKADDYVTLIKQEPLTYDELVTYNNGYEIGRDNVDSNSGVISYYKSDSCYYNSDSDKNTIGCSNDYDNSFIKNIVNNWSNPILNDLKETDGYKARLISNEELNNMGHIFLNNTSGPFITRSNYDCLYSDSDYWTMSSSSDSIFYSDVVSKTDTNNGYQFVDKKYAVRPVINLKKCAIDNTCE